MNRRTGVFHHYAPFTKKLDEPLSGESIRGSKIITREQSTVVFDGPSAEQDEASSHAWEEMERLGMISP